MYNLVTLSNNQRTLLAGVMGIVKVRTNQAYQLSLQNKLRCLEVLLCSPLAACSETR